MTRTSQFTKQQPKSKWIMLSTIFAITSLVMIATASIGLYAAYPTERHREVARQFIDISSSPSGDLDLDSDGYRALEATPEAIYSRNVDIVSTILQIAIFVAIVRFVYVYLRKQRSTKNPISATVAVVVLANTLSALAIVYIGDYYLGTTTMPFPLMLLLVAFTSAITLLLTYLLARLFKWHYDKRHSFDIS